MRALLSMFVTTTLVACSASHHAARDAGAPTDARLPTDAGTPEPHEGRIPDRAVVALLGDDAGGRAWWIEERIAGQPIYVGDHELGPRSLVFAAPERTVAWTPPAGDRLTDATLHPSGAWSAVGVDAAFRIFLVRGEGTSVRARITLDDPALADDPWAWSGTPPDGLRAASITETGVSIVADGEDVVVGVPTRENALVVYRWRWEGAAWSRGMRTLASPSIGVSPIMGIGGSYDDFDAYVAPYLLHLGIDAATGRVFVATYVDRTRVRRHNEAFGTHVDLLREVLYPRENTSDVLVVGIDPDGTLAFSSIVGTVDVEDELSGLTVGPDRIAVFGRSRRELGRDNTELHAMVSELSLEGEPLGTTTFDAEVSGLFEAALYVGETLVVGGSEGWAQNPSGRSLFSNGHPFLVRLDGEGARVVTRLDALVPATEGHAELRALALHGAALRLGGHERGPLTHTGDADRSLIRSDAWWIDRALPPAP